MIGFKVQRFPQVNRNSLTLGLILALLVIEVLLGTGLVPKVGAQIRPETIVTAVGAVLILLVTLKRIEYGIVLLPIVAAAVPFSVGTGTGSVLVASLLFAAFLIGLRIVLMLIRRDLLIVDSPINLPLLGFVVTAFLATLNSNVMRDPIVYVWPSFPLVQMGGLGVIVISAGLLWVVMNSIRDLRWIRWLVWVFLGIGGIVIVAYGLRFASALAKLEAGGLFSMWVVALAFGQALYNHQLPRWGRVGLLLLAVAWLYRRFFPDGAWLSGWVPAFIAVLAISFLKSRWLSALTAVGVGFVVLLRYDELYTTQLVGSERAGNLLRLDLWRQNLEITKDHLLLGTGPGGYAPYYMTFFPDRALSTHSNYLDVFAQTGLVGSFFFVWFMVALFLVALKVRRKWPTGFAVGFASGAFGGLIGLAAAMALGDWFIPFVYNQTIAGFSHTVYSWLFLGALASMQRSLSE